MMLTPYYLSVCPRHKDQPERLECDKSELREFQYSAKFKEAIETNNIISLKCLILADKAYGNYYSQEDLNNALITAVKNENYCATELLLQHGSQIDFQNEEQKTALYIAIKIKNTQLISLLLEYGANIDNLDNDFNTELHLAARYPALYEYILAIKPEAKLLLSSSWQNKRQQTPEDIYNQSKQKLEANRSKI